MTAIILSVGDELVLGQTVDTNSAWISQQLAAVGCDVAGHATVGDDQAAIERAIASAAGGLVRPDWKAWVAGGDSATSWFGVEPCDLLVISGGIGPTEDDLTREALAAVMDVALVERPAWTEKLEAFFASLGREMRPGNRKQAFIPRGAEMLDNPVGTAAGIAADLIGGPTTVMSVGSDRADRPRHRCRVFVVPGVPKEMQRLVSDYVLPYARERAGGAAIRSRTLHTFGRGESDVAHLVGPDLMRRGRNPSVGTTVSGGVVSLRLNSRFESPARAASELDQTEAAVSDKLGDLIYGRDGETLQQAVAAMLIEKKQTVATAESCTGGLIAKMLTDVPGSSAYFHAGFVTYSNAAKYERLGVNREMLAVYGAVSPQVVESMARSARKLAKSTYALAVSGVAGPDGGTADKPVGTVCLCLAHPQKGELLDAAVTTRTLHLPGDREWVRDRSAKSALAMLRYHLLGRELPF